MPISTPRKNINKSIPVPLTDEEQLKGLLKRYYTNGNGQLSRQELKVAFKSLGLHFTGFKARKAIREADLKDDGFISEEDEMEELVSYAKKWGFTLK